MKNRQSDSNILVRWWLAAAVLVLGALFIAIVFVAGDYPSVFSVDGFALPAILLTFVLMVIPAPWGVARFALTVGATILFGAGFLYFALNSPKTEAVTQGIIGVALELVVLIVAVRMFGARQRLRQVVEK